MNSCQEAHYSRSLYRQPVMTFSRINPHNVMRGPILWAMDPAYSPFRFETPEQTKNPGQMGSLLPLSAYTRNQLIQAAYRTQFSGSY